MYWQKLLIEQNKSISTCAHTGRKKLSMYRCIIA